jgi:hypothetical protein
LATVGPALWFHDAVYDRGAADNEDRRAATFAAAARGKLSQDLIAAVRGLIVATKHQAPSADAAHRGLLDCDLAALGRNRKAFERTSAATPPGFYARLWPSPQSAPAYLSDKQERAPEGGDVARAPASTKRRAP